MGNPHSQFISYPTDSGQDKYAQQKRCNITTINLFLYCLILLSKIASVSLPVNLGRGVYPQNIVVNEDILNRVACSIH